VSKTVKEDVLLQVRDLMPGPQQRRDFLVSCPVRQPQFYLHLHSRPRFFFPKCLSDTPHRPRKCPSFSYVAAPGSLRFTSTYIVTLYLFPNCLSDIRHSPRKCATFSYVAAPGNLSFISTYIIALDLFPNCVSDTPHSPSQCAARVWS